MTAANALKDLGQMLVTGQIEIVDCSGTLGPATPLLKLPPDLGTDTPKIEIHQISEYDNRGPWWSWNWLKIGEHSGTHFDAPHHWVTGKDFSDGYTDTLDVNRLIAPVNVIDCSKEAEADNDFLLNADHIKAWESAHGQIEAEEWVVMRTDWDKRSNDEAAFLNFDENGPHNPGITPDGIEYLLSKGIVGFGTQCVGTDAGQATALEPPFPAHSLLHKNNCFGIASLANLDKVPPKGAIFCAAPLKIKDGTGSPIRALAMVPKG